MCTSFISNRKKTIVGFNLDILDMKHKIVEEDDKVYIAIFDEKEGWLPLFGGNANGNFVGMPTCWPYDSRSDQKSSDDINIINLDIDFLLGKYLLKDVKEIVDNRFVCSVPNLTFQSQLSDINGNVLQVIPGQANIYKEKPVYSIMTNFSPIKGYSELHPWMGYDRYLKAQEILENANDDFDYLDGFKLLKECSQEVCPTVVSLIYDANDNIMYYCENRDFKNIKVKRFNER